MAQEATAGPLSGVRVLELSVAIAGPATAGILSDWSAPSPLPCLLHPTPPHSDLSAHQGGDGDAR